LAWYSRKKKAMRRFTGKGRPKSYKSWKTKQKRQNVRYRRFNKKHNVVGWYPDSFISPIDFVPYAGQANKAYRASKFARYATRGAVAGTKAIARSKSRRGGRSKSSSKGRVKRRGKYYYYRGKRVYRR